MTHMAPVPGMLHLDDWSGRSAQRVLIVGRTPYRFRIRALTRTRLAGRGRYLEPGAEATAPITAITLIPLTKKEDHQMSIIQDWACNLGIRHQGVIISAVRGCDTMPKNGAAKTLSRFYRGAILRPHCGDIAKAQSFMSAPRDDFEFMETAKCALDEMDAAPMHYVLHLVHAAQIVGLYHPDATTRSQWSWFYLRCVRKFHLAPESEQELNRRLNADEDSFGREQRS